MMIVFFGKKDTEVPQFLPVNLLELVRGVIVVYL